MTDYQNGDTWEGHVTFEGADVRKLRAIQRETGDTRNVILRNALRAYFEEVRKDFTLEHDRVSDNE